MVRDLVRQAERVIATYDNNAFKGRYTQEQIDRLEPIIQLVGTLVTLIKMTSDEFKRTAYDRSDASAEAIHTLDSLLQRIK